MGRPGNINAWKRLNSFLKYETGLVSIGRTFWFEKTKLKPDSSRQGQAQDGGPISSEENMLRKIQTSYRDNSINDAAVFL